MTNKDSVIKSIGKFLLVAIPVGVGVLLIVKYVNNQKAMKAANTYTGGLTGLFNNGVFPIQMGSSGDMVKKIQQAIIRKGGDSSLPVYGVDGQFGNETKNGLLKYFNTISVNNQQQYDSIINS